MNAVVQQSTWVPRLASVGRPGAFRPIAGSEPVYMHPFAHFFVPWGNPGKLKPKVSLLVCILGLAGRSMVFEDSCDPGAVGEPGTKMTTPQVRLDPAHL